MPAPVQVELHPHDPAWAERAVAEAERLRATLGAVLVRVHHIGSTAIPGIIAKPIIDLMPVVSDLAALDQHRAAVKQLRYQWWGEYGLPGRRYCNLDDAQSGKRVFQLHFYAEGSPEIRRHLAFRDYLRSNPEIAAQYEAVKRQCRDAHPDDSHAYSDCKSSWIKRIESDALETIASRSA